MVMEIETMRGCDVAQILYAHGIHRAELQPAKANRFRLRRVGMEIWPEFLDQEEATEPKPSTWRDRREDAE